MKFLGFTEGGCFVQRDGMWRYRGLPESLQSRLSSVVQFHTLAIGTNNSYFCTFKGPDGRNSGRYQGLNSEYPRLYEVIQQSGQQGAKFDSWEVVLGPNGNYYAYNNLGTRYHALSDPFLSKLVRETRPQVLSLGVANSYVMVRQQGEIVWDLKGQYDSLETVLQDAPSGVKLVYLSPFERGHWFVRFKDGSGQYVCPDSWDM